MTWHRTRCETCKGRGGRNVLRIEKMRVLTDNGFSFVPTKTFERWKTCSCCAGKGYQE